MAAPKYAERVVGLETEWKVFRTETFPAFQESLRGEFAALGEKIDAASLNGQTPRVKNLATKLGNPEDVAILEMVVESHKRRTWLFAPLKSIPRGVVNAALWVTTAAIMAPFLATANAWLHAAIPSIP
jgi:hypothetical protein